MLAPIGGISRRDAIHRASAGRWINDITGQGGDIDSHTQATFAFPGRLDRWTIDNLLEFSAMSSRIVHREPDDAIREGLTLGQPGSKPGQIIPIDSGVERAIQDELDRLEALTAVSDGRRWGRAYGGGAVVMFVDDQQDFDQPINFSTLRRFVALAALDRWEIQPEPSIATRLGKPVHYQIATAGQHMRIHASRVIPFDGTKLPRRVKEANQWWGGSVLDLIWAELRNWATSHEYAAEGVALMTQGIFKTKNLAAAIDKGDTDAAIDRLEALRIGLGVLGDMMIDKDEEDYEIVSRPLTGIGEALDALDRALVAASDMPRSILFGETPGGLNSGGNEGEIISWYDHVRVKQTMVYAPPMRRILNVLMRTAEGPTGGQVIDVRPVFPPLWQESNETKAKNRVSNAQARSLDTQSRIVSTDEVRQDPDLIESYDIDPEAPAPPEPEAGEPVGEGGEPEAEDEAQVDDAALMDTPLADMPSGEVLISGGIAARRLGFKTTGPIRRMHANGNIPAARINGRWRYAWSSIVAHIRSGK